jgi:hypothetical protein
MNILQKRWVVMVVGGILVIGIVAAIVFWHSAQVASQSANNSAGQNNASSADMTTSVTNIVAPPVVIATSSAPTPPSSKPSAPSTPATGSVLPAGPPPITISLITPISNNVWTIGGSNPIVWNNPAEITGEIDLVNATTKAFIGVITSNIGAKQTSYNWNARSIFLGRYSADQKDVVPGVYSIRIKFDGNGLGDLVSGPITITN